MSESIPLCPVLHPSYEQFKNFEQYVNKVEQQYSKEYGMVKIIPPPEWISRSTKYKEILKSLVFEKPEHQTLYSRPNGFAFQCENGKSQKTFTFEEFKEAAHAKRKEIMHLKSLQAIEQQFWKTVKNTHKEIYCANVEVSLMDSKSEAWEFEHLQSMFSHAVKEELKGLNTSFLFIGAWKTFFNWHVEDLDLSAINILHEGATKTWYAIHPADKKLFEGIMKDIFPEQAISCPNFMRHKSTFANPYKLKERYPFLRISRMYQQPHEISLALSEGYHCGFNMGFNIAEAVNYAANSWLDKLVKFRGCKCSEKIGVAIQSFQEVIENLKKSPIYKKIKDMPAFKKLQEKALLERKEDEEFDNLSKEEIYKEFLKMKTKPINKGLKEIYVPRFKRYFDCTYNIEPEYSQSIECNKCHKWRTVSEDVISKYKSKLFNCKFIGKQCQNRDNKHRGNKVNGRGRRNSR